MTVKVSRTNLCPVLSSMVDPTDLSRLDGFCLLEVPVDSLFELLHLFLVSLTVAEADTAFLRGRTAGAFFIIGGLGPKFNGIDLLSDCQVLVLESL